MDKIDKLMGGSPGTEHTGTGNLNIPLILENAHRCNAVCHAIVIVIAIVMAIFLGQFCPSGKRTIRLTLSKAPTRETRPDHNTA